MWNYLIAGLIIVPCALAEEPAPEVLAIKKALPLLEKSAKNYPTHRECFACHHQTFPILAFDAAKRASLEVNEKMWEEIREFTHASMESRKEGLLKGEGVGGKAFTASYALWTLDLAGQKSDETTTAIVEYLIKIQQEDGGFPRHSLRPPLEESLVASTVLSTYYARKFASENQKAAVDTLTERAKAWLEKAEFIVHEDYVFRLWGMKLLDYPEEKLQAAQEAVLKRQKEDGGFSGQEDLASDAYSTGQTLYVLRETGLSSDSPATRSAVSWLLEHQKEDGSWHVVTRSTPIQTFFDNGDPHGKDQFISITATGWAAAALARNLIK